MTSKKADVSFVNLINSPWTQIILVILFALLPMMNMVGQLMEKESYLKTFIARDISLMRDALATKQPTADGEAVFNPQKYKYFSYEFFGDHIEVFDARKLKVVPSAQRAFFYFISDKSLKLKHSILKPKAIWDPGKSDKLNLKNYKAVPKFCIGAKEMFVVDAGKPCGEITLPEIKVERIQIIGRYGKLYKTALEDSGIPIKKEDKLKPGQKNDLKLQLEETTIDKITIEVSTRSKELSGIAKRILEQIRKLEQVKKLDQIKKDTKLEVDVKTNNKLDKYGLVIIIKARPAVLGKIVKPVKEILIKTIKKK